MKAPNTPAPYTADEYEALAKRIALCRGDGSLALTHREWDMLFTALGIAAACEQVLERQREQIERALQAGADI